MNERIKVERDFFISKLENCSKVRKKRFHYNSVLNLSDGIMLYYNSEADSLKELLINFFKELNYDELGQRESLQLYKSNLLPIGNYLIDNEKYRTKASIFIYILIGIIVDIIIYYFIFKNYTFPIASIIFLFLGYLRRFERIKSRKFFSTNW